MHALDVLPECSSLSSLSPRYLIQYTLVTYMPFSTQVVTIGENNGAHLSNRRSGHHSHNLGLEISGVTGETYYYLPFERGA